jgi:hypothetical protein
MCLRYKVKSTKRYIKRFKRSETVTVWKGLKLVEGNLCSPYFSSTIWKPGNITGKIRSYDYNRNPINNGDAITSGSIHVWKNKYFAEKWLKNFLENQSVYQKYPVVLVKMTAKISDLVGVGSQDNEYDGAVAFKKVFLSTEDYNSAFRT